MNKKNNPRQILLEAVRQMKRKTVQNERKAYLTYTQKKLCEKELKKEENRRKKQSQAERNLKDKDKGKTGEIQYCT